MRSAFVVAVLIASAVAVGAAPKGQSDRGVLKGSAADGGFGLAGLVDSDDAGRYDGGKPFNGFALNKELSAKGDLSKDEIKGVVKAHHGEINACYQGLLERNKGKQPLPQGTAQLQFVVSPEGKVAEAGIAPGGGVDDPAFVKCVVEHVSAWVFPAPRGGGPVKVAYPVKLEPTE